VLSALAEYVFSGVNGFSAIRVLRALRLARTLRIIRVVTIFRNLQLIVQGLLNSFLSLIWMLVLLLLALYLVSIIFVSAASTFIADEVNRAPEAAIGTGDDLDDQMLRLAFSKSFRTVPRAMLSMFFSVTGGLDWYDVARPLMHISAAYVVVFALYIIFVVFGVFNVLNACFVESILSNRDKDLLIQAEQARTKAFMRDLADLFKEADADRSNEIGMEELEEYCRNPRFCAYLSTHALDASDAKVLFEFLDQDASGTVDIEEFVLGALKLKGPARCLDMLKVQGNFARLQEQLDAIESVVGVRKTVSSSN